jgi:signal transduction histidine kinase
LQLWRAAAQWQWPIVVAAAYFLGAQAAFFIGTLSDKIFALFWPPNVILLCALLTAPPKAWWRYIVCAFPVHVVAELGVGMPAARLMVAFVTNCTVALLSAYAVRRFIGRPPWFGTFYKTGLYILIAGVITPSLAALGGAFVAILGGGSLSDYWLFWAHWLLANALPNLTIGSAFLTWWSNPSRRVKWPLSRHQIEATVLGLTIIVACAIIGIVADNVPQGFLAALLFLLVPPTLWAAVRFGERGASAAVLIVSVFLTWRVLREPALFVGLEPRNDVLALQFFLLALSIPMLMLGAATNELRVAEARARGLAAAVLKAQDEERCRIARGLHDSTGQNLIAATLFLCQLRDRLPASAVHIVQRLEETLQQCIGEIRTVSYLLHPPFLDEAGLSMALREYVDGFIARSGIKVELDISPDLESSRDVELALFRIVQEALTNVARHSESMTARIGLHRQDEHEGGGIVLTIEDHGKGMPAAGHNRLTEFLGRASHSGGLGLASMRERVGQLCGSIEIDSRAGRTILRARIPNGATHGVDDAAKLDQNFVPAALHDTRPVYGNGRID